MLKKVAALFLIFIFALSLASCGSTFDWNELVLKDMLPQIETNKGEIHENTASELWIDVYKVSDEQYNNYIQLCKDKGFNIDAEETSIGYAAYNAEGYQVDLFHNSYDKNLTIQLYAPMEMSELKWPTQGIAASFPIPKSAVGRIEWEYSDSFLIYVGDTTVEDWQAYVDECVAKGYNVDYSKGDDYYYAKNSEGYSLSVEYVGYNIMSIRVDEPSNSSGEAASSTQTGGNSQTPYPEAFESACADINIDISQVKDWEQTENWANGERFQFSYKNHPFVVYVNSNGTINSIKLGGTNGTEIFKQGYVPYNVDDYLVDEDIAVALIPYAEDTVKLALNYPSTADFSLFNWSYGREGNLYQLQSSVKAKNAFGVEEEMPFTVIFDMGTVGKANCVYLELNGVVIDSDLPKKPEREKVSINEGNSDSTNDVIRLIDGELGDYGRSDPNYPEYVDYYIPSGSYTVYNNAKNSVVMIIDNSSNDEVRRVTLSEGQSGNFDIQSNQHIELTIYSDVTLTEIK